jgi:hypothetical protein
MLFGSYAVYSLHHLHSRQHVGFVFGLGCSTLRTKWRVSLVQKGAPVFSTETANLGLKAPRLVPRSRNQDWKRTFSPALKGASCHCHGADTFSLDWSGTDYLDFFFHLHPSGGQVSPIPDPQRRNFPRVIRELVPIVISSSLCVK